VHVVDGEPADRCRGLGVEEQQQAGEAVFGFDGVVVQQAPGDVPAVLVVQGLGRAVPAQRGNVDGGELVCLGPADEMPGCLAVGGGLVGEPPVQIDLSAGGQGELLCVEPVEEGEGRLGALPDGVDLLCGGGAAVVAAA
jgi:hypothetical protein